MAILYTQWNHLEKDNQKTLEDYRGPVPHVPNYVGAHLNIWEGIASCMLSRRRKSPQMKAEIYLWMVHSENT